MRYTDNKIMETLVKPKEIINEEAVHMYRDSLDHLDGVSIELLNKPENVYIDSHGEITFKYTLEVRYDKYGIDAVYLTLVMIDDFDITYIVEPERDAPEDEEDEEMEEPIDGRRVELSRLCKELPCNLRSFNWRITVDYNTNKIVEVNVE